MGFAVVEILQTGGLVEGLFDVAFFAIGAQVVVVSVFVAAVAMVFVKQLATLRIRVGDKEGRPSRTKQKRKYH